MAMLPSLGAGSMDPTSFLLAERLYEKSDSFLSSIGIVRAILQAYKVWKTYQEKNTAEYKEAIAVVTAKGSLTPAQTNTLFTAIFARADRNDMVDLLNTGLDVYDAKIKEDEENAKKNMEFVQQLFASGKRTSQNDNLMMMLAIQQMSGKSDSASSDVLSLAGGFAPLLIGGLV